MIAAVARIYRPGCQVDTALIIEGKQGIWKSSFFRVLGGDWFTDQLSEMHQKDALIETQGAWIIELAELDSMHRSEVSRIKKYLAFREDRYRPPYDRLAIKVPRQCVFCGTVNPDGNPYLRDVTGGRRFWCFAAGTINLEHVVRDARQLWGEAVARYRNGEKWFLHEEHLVTDAAAAVAERTDPGINEAWAEPIAQWLRFREHEEVTTFAVMRGALGFEDTVLHTKLSQMEVGKILHYLGWERNPSVRPIRWRKKVGV
jgi:predicted P-loop ATPase